MRRAVARDGEVRIRGGSGTVRITGWDQDSLVVTGSHQPGLGRFLFEEEGTTITLGVQVPLAHADLEIFVPQGGTVRVRVQTASVAVTGVRGELELESVDGPLRVEGSPRELLVDTRGGTVDLGIDRAESVRVTAMTGAIEFRGAAADLSLVSILGSVDAEVPAARHAKVESTEGSVRFAGRVVAGGTVEASTHSGEIEIVLDPSSSVASDVASLLGEVTTEFPGASPDPDFSGTRLLFDIGAAAGRLEVRSFSGDVHVGRGDVRKNPLASREGTDG